MIERDKAPPPGRGAALTRRAALGATASLATVVGAQAASIPGSAQPPTDGLVTPEQFGASGEGVQDDTAAVQAALDSGRSIRFAPGRIYNLRSALRLARPQVTLTGGGTLRIARDYAASIEGAGSNVRLLTITGPDATIDGLFFDATDAPMGTAVENGFIWSRAAGTTVRGCRFAGLRKGTTIWALGDSPYLHVIGCRFDQCSGAVFTKGRNSIIACNIIVDATDAAIAINGTTCAGAVVTGNSIANERLAVIPSMIAVEEGASDWTITGNTLLGVNGGGILCTHVFDGRAVKGGVIADNIVSGPRFDGKRGTTNLPGALLAISAQYLDWVAHDNRLSDCTSSNSNARLAMLAASGGSFHDNIVDGSASPGLSAVIGIAAGVGGLAVRNNRTVAAPGTRHFLFGEGDYGGRPCSFAGGCLYGGAVGIDAEFTIASIRGLALHLRDIDDCTARMVVNAATLLGDRARLLNAGGWERPHRIGASTTMFADAIPVDGGRMPFRPGDRFDYLTPGARGPLGVVRTPTGWREIG